MGGMDSVISELISELSGRSGIDESSRLVMKSSRKITEILFYHFQ